MSAVFNCLKAPLWSLFFALLICLPVQANQSAIASAHPLATSAGIKVLEQGGNAFDAAITVSAVLGVVEPYSSAFGGGGFWLLHRESDQKQVMIDGREKAPLAAHKDMYLDASGNVIANASINGPLSAGIPGTPAALVHLAENYALLPLQQTLAPAIVLAEQGFEVGEFYQKMAGWRLQALRDSFSASEIFLQDDDVPETGYRVRQPDLAKTLRHLAEKGFAGFYRGEVAERLVKGVRDNGGIWTEKDPSGYEVIERPPVVFNYNNKKIISAALPSSGGIVMAQIFNILSAYDFKNLSQVKQKHLVIEAMRRAYQQRAKYLGDSDFVTLNLEKLTSKVHARRLAEDIDLNRASVSKGLVSAAEGRDTTHFSIIDNEGNRVAATLSINYPFGSGFVPEGTGVLLNDEMDDFSASPGVPNVYGLVGSQANAIEPGKRMLSSMSPTFVESDKGIAILGTPGGSRIITMVTQAILAMEDSLDPKQWVDLPRFHHQYLPDQVEYEPGALTAEEIKQLTAMGHQLQQVDNPFGNMQAIYLDKKTGKVSAASDSRGIGAAQVK